MTVPIYPQRMRNESIRRNWTIITFFWLGMWHGLVSADVVEAGAVVQLENTQVADAEALEIIREEPALPTVNEPPSGKAVCELTANATTVLKNMDALLALLDTAEGLRVAEEMVRGIRESRVSLVRQRAYGRFFQYVVRILREGHPRIPRHEALRLVCSCLYFPESGSFVYPTSDIRSLRHLLEVYLRDPDPAVRTMALDRLVLMGCAQPCLAWIFA